MLLNQKISQKSMHIFLRYLTDSQILWDNLQLPDLGSLILSQSPSKINLFFPHPAGYPARKFHQIHNTTPYIGLHLQILLYHTYLFKMKLIYGTQCNTAAASMTQFVCSSHAKEKKDEASDSCW